MDGRVEHFRRREQAAALVIVLAFVVLVTGLAVAYLARTTTDRAVARTSFNQSNADQLAESAADTIIADFRQEIVNGSTATLVGSSTIYAPKSVGTRTSNDNMLPVRNAPGTILNLIRRSAQDDVVNGANAVAAPGLSSRASAVNSGPVNSANPKRGEITLARWNKHYLIPTGANPPAPIADFVAPDWVIATRGGPTVFNTWNAALRDATPTNDTYAIGRYAYAVYDEGGLLDVNVAGYPPTATTAAQYGPKGVAAFADLTVATIGMSQSDIDHLVGWRNYASAQPNGNFTNFTFNAGSATNYVNFVLSNTNGFMAVGTNTTGGGNKRTDQAFVNRQSLLQFRTSNGFTADALQYLGTFSRELNAPSWTPTQDALDMGGNNGGGTYAYKTNADSTTAINRNLLNVRVINPFTRADGTTAAGGDPLINRRFPITRLSGLGPSGPVTTINSTIVNGVLVPASTIINGVTTVQRDFGLLWDNVNNRWNYVGPTGSTVLTTIETLNQVAAENPGREPNFFELLKTAILSGSVGLGSGTGSAPTFVNAETKYYSTPLSSDYQIIQIGANMIDQWDSDNVPTFIGFGNDPGTLQPYELAGIENVPYLNKLVFKPIWTTIKGKSGNPDTYQFEGWLLPSLWNPHQNATSGTGNVRIAMTSGTMTASTTSPNGTSSPPIGSTNQYMTVAASLFGALPSAPTAVVNTGAGSSITKNTKSPDLYYGFYFTIPATITPPSSSTTAYPDFGTGCDFQMQVQVNGTWKPYQTWKGCGPNHPLICQSPPDWTATTIQDPEFVTVDPRTLRFGVWGNAGKQSGAATDYTSGVLTTLDLSGGVYETIPTAVTALRPHGSMFASSTLATLYLYANNLDGTVHYTDLDGVQRLGDFIGGATTAMLPTDSADRPLILSGAYPSPTPSAYANGGFQSVAELGEVFRDQPWKTLNFTTASPNATSRSADAGLLDIFTLHESSMEAGKTSLNTRQKSVLTAILSQATKRLTGANILSNSTERDPIVNALFTLTQAQPMINKAELITRLAADASVTGLGNKEARECVLRAFSDACQTRTWNLMIDVIAQSGRYPPNASTLAGFLVEGEQHYWVHVAIDRFTGQVIDKQIEVVNE